MSRRVTRVGALMALTLLGSLLVGGVALGQREKKPLEVTYREQEGSPGRLKITVAMSGTQWRPELRLRGTDFAARAARSTGGGTPGSTAG